MFALMDIVISFIYTLQYKIVHFLNVVLIKDMISNNCSIKCILRLQSFCIEFLSD